MEQKVTELSKNAEEILLITAEECGEVVQAITKIFRFGLDVEYNGITNTERLIDELGDVVCMIGLVMEEFNIPEELLSQSAFNKLEKLRKWSRIQDLG